MLVDILPLFLGGNLRYEKGFYHTKFPYNGNLDIWNANAPFNQDCFVINDFNNYGVCDSPEQFAEDFKELIESDPRPMVVMFTHVAKDVSNKGLGGGWRWHKWGPYVGKGTPTREYLDDEEGFNDGVYVYTVYDVVGVTQAKITSSEEPPHITIPD